MKIKHFALLLLFLFLILHNLSSQENTLKYCDVECYVRVFNDYKIDTLKKWKPLINIYSFERDSILINFEVYAGKIVFLNEKITSHRLETTIHFKMGLSTDCLNSVNHFYTKPIKIIDMIVKDDNLREQKYIGSKHYQYYFSLKSEIEKIIKQNPYYNLNQIVFTTKITNLSNGKVCYFEQIKPICID